MYKLPSEVVNATALKMMINKACNIDCLKGVEYKDEKSL